MNIINFINRFPDETYVGKATKAKSEANSNEAELLKNTQKWL